LDPWWNPFAEKQGIGRASYWVEQSVVRFITKTPWRKKSFGYRKQKNFRMHCLMKTISPEIEENLDFILA
jgi:non-specific serine/threonine protein kinase